MLHQCRFLRHSVGVFLLFISSHLTSLHVCYVECDSEYNSLLWLDTSSSGTTLNGESSSAAVDHAMSSSSAAINDNLLNSQRQQRQDGYSDDWCLGWENKMENCPPLSRVPPGPWKSLNWSVAKSRPWKYLEMKVVLECPWKVWSEIFLCIIGLLRSDTVNFCKIVIQLITYLRLDGRIAMLPCGSYLRKGRWKSLNSKAWEDGVPWLRRGIINCGDGWMKVILYYVQCYKYFGAFISLVWSDLITKPPAMQSSMLGACPKPG